MYATGVCASALLLVALPMDGAHAQYAGARVSPRSAEPVLPAPPPQPTVTPLPQPAPGLPAPASPAQISPLPTPAAQMAAPVAQPPALPPNLAAASAPIAPAVPAALPEPMLAEPQPVPQISTVNNTAAVPPGTPTESTIVNLIRLLVDEGVLTQDRAGVLIRQAEDEAVIAARSAKAETASIAGLAPAAQPPGQIAQTASPAPPQSIRVPYVPEFVRKQISDEVKQELVQQAILEHWAQPDAVPEWTRRFHFYGDFRLRYEWDLFDGRNSPFFPNFVALNAGNPFDLNNAAGTPPPLLDTTEDRERMRIRARLGIDVDITDNFKGGLRLATGNTTNPVTTNQNLGTTLNKDNFLLDRAYLEYKPIEEVALLFGRFASPWFSTDDVWDEDLNFDGVAVAGHIPVVRKLDVFAAGGAFPIETSIFNFPDNSSAKQKSRDKWLYGAQAGLDLKPTTDSAFKLAVAYYDFDSIQGQLSSPCVAVSSADMCNTDNSRPGFSQGGNTLFAIRDLVPVSTNPPIFQYYGLASPFRELNVTARLDIATYDPIHLIFDADFVKNVAFNSARIAALNPVNNRGASPGGGAPGPYDGGSLGFQGRFTVGYPALVNRWDWNISAGYKYIESDAVVDAFNDSDFHLGGTNAKGYVVGGGLGIAHNVNLFARWLSASEVSGSPYSVDVVLVDLNAQF
jgi:hypothetical protein